MSCGISGKPPSRRSIPTGRCRTGVGVVRSTKGEAMPVKELGHLVLYVSDLERSAAFYRDVLGWRQIESPGNGFPAAAFSSGRTHHELLLIEVGPTAEPIP